MFINDIKDEVVNYYIYCKCAKFSNSSTHVLSGSAPNAIMVKTTNRII